MKKFISVLLVALTLYMCLPVMAYATDNYEMNEDVSYSADNALGGVLANAMSESNDALGNNNGYGVFGIVFNEDTVDVSLAAPDYSTVVVALYEEDSLKMITSGKVYASSDDDIVTVALAEYSKPEYFVIKVFIVDYNNAPVCEAYENKEYTEAFEKFFSKNVFDFEEEKIISINNDIETNFAVVSDDTKVIEAADGKNIVVTDDYVNGIYVFENADENIKNLQRGDTFYYVYGEDYILTKVGKVKTEGDFTTVTADSTCEISDLFSYIDINTSKQPSTSTFAYDDDSGNDDIDKIYKIASGEKKFEDENCYLKFSVDADVMFHLSFYYDLELFGTDKYEIEFWVSVLAHADIEANLSTSLEKSFELVDKSIPVLTGLDLTVRLEATITFEASITARGEIIFTMKNGVKTNHNRTKEIKEKPVIILNIEVDGNYELHFIPELAVGVKLLKVISAELDVPVDFSTEGILYVTTPEEKDKHSCAICIDGTIDVNVKLEIVVKFGVDQESAKKIVNIKPVDADFHLGDYYISISDTGVLKFGFGSCANTVVHTQSCGTFLTATMFNDGELVISGVGGMYSSYTYSLSSSQIELPWWHAYSERIETVTIEEGVTDICDGAFVSCDSLTNASIPLSLTKIGKFAFAFCDNFKTILYNGSTAQWDNVKIGTLAGLSKVTVVCYEPYTLRTVLSDDVIVDNTNSVILYSTRNITSESVELPILGNSYVIIVVKDDTEEDLLSDENLLYIDQKTAENEELLFEFEIDESVTDYDILYTNAFIHRHSYSGIATKPTCEEDGFITYSCSCGDGYVESINAHGHDYVSEITEPTCTEKGYSTYKCSCGDVYVSDYVKEKAHTYTSSVTKEPTHLEKGIITYTCICNDSYTEEIEKLEAHTYTSSVTKQPTHLENGVTTYTCICGDTYTEEIEKLKEHTFGDKDEKCECGFDRTEGCSCNCHKGGINGFFFKIILFFQKIFKSNQLCKCGVKHY